MPLSGGIFAWESVLPTENRIATPVCGLVRNDSVLLTEQHCAYASSSSLLSYWPTFRTSVRGVSGSILRATRR